MYDNVYEHQRSSNLNQLLGIFSQYPVSPARFMHTPEFVSSFGSPSAQSKPVIGVFASLCTQYHTPSIFRPPICIRSGLRDGWLFCSLLTSRSHPMNQEWLSFRPYLDTYPVLGPRFSCQM